MLEFSISNQLLTRLDSTEVYSDSCNYLKAKFVFSSDWAGVIPVATFAHATDTETYSVRLVQGECLVPVEVIKPGKISLSVCGAGEVEGAIAHIPTGVVTIDVEESGHQMNLNPDAPTQSLYDTLLSQLADAEEEAGRAAAESKAYLQGGSYQDPSGTSQTITKGVQTLAAEAQSAKTAAQAAQAAAEAAKTGILEAQTSAQYYAGEAKAAAEAVQDSADDAEEAANQAARAKAYAVGGSYLDESGTEQTVTLSAKSYAQSAQADSADAAAAAEQAVLSQTAAAQSASQAGTARTAAQAAQMAAETAKTGAQTAQTAAEAAAEAAEGQLEAVSVHLEDQDNPHHVTPYQVGGVPILQTRYPPGWNEEEYGADGEYYELLLPEGITLEAGMLVTVIFHKTSVTKDPYMVMGNPQRDYPIKRPGRWGSLSASGGSVNWLMANTPVLLQFTGDKFLALGYPSIFAADLSGMLGVAKGGTGGTTAAAARENLEAARKYEYGPVDPETAGVTLAEGQLYFVYESEGE